MKSEKGRTYTLGVVFRSPFEHALSRNISDGHRLVPRAVSKAIDQVGAQTTYDLCFNRDGMQQPGPTASTTRTACAAASSATTSLASGCTSILTYVNLGLLDTSGIDLQRNLDGAARRPRLPTCPVPCPSISRSTSC